MVLEKTLESPLNCKINPVNPKEKQPWISIGRTDDEALILCPPDAKNWLIGKDPDAEKDWKQKEKGMIEDEMVRWHHWLDGHEFEQAPRIGDGQGDLACFSPWGWKEFDMTEWQNWTDSFDIFLLMIYYLPDIYFTFILVYSNDFRQKANWRNF